MLAGLDTRDLVVGIGVVSAASLAAALVFQHGFGAEACNLCILQRWPHLAVVVLGGVAALTLRRGRAAMVPTLRRRPVAGVLLALMALLLLGNAGLAGYHVGIEQGLWALPAGCVAGAAAGSVEELKALLQDAAPTCDQVTFTLFGLSLAVWNLVLCLVLGALAIHRLLVPLREAHEPATAT